MPGTQAALSSLQTRGEGWGTRAWVLLVLLIVAHPPGWREEEVPAGWRRYRLEKQIKPRNRYLARF